jgi:hypothetical protein
MGLCTHPETCSDMGIHLHCFLCKREHLLMLCHCTPDSVVVKTARRLGWTYSHKTRLAKCPRCKSRRTR